MRKRIIIYLSVICLLSILYFKNDNALNYHKVPTSPVPAPVAIQTEKEIPEKIIAEGISSLNELYQYDMGDVIGTITITELDIIDSPLYYGTDLKQLAKGICVCEESGGWQMFGTQGRTLISCHNDREFRYLDKLSVGDQIQVTVGSRNYLYEVIGTDISYIAENTWAEKAYYATPEYGLTLSTCYPYRTKIKDKWIVNCKMVEGHKFFEI